MNRSIQLLIGVVIVILILAATSLFTVQQYQSAVLLRLGKIEQNAKGQYKIFGPGLHAKLPLIEKVKKFDMRLQTLSIDSSRIMTAEQKEVLVDAYVKWRIGNVVQYFKATGGLNSQANLLLTQQVNDGMRQEFGKRNIAQLLSDDRVQVMQQILKKVQGAAKEIGVSVVDVRIKRIDLPTEVAEAVYSRMSKAREKMASLIRAQGQEQANIIRAKAEADVTVILATAKSEAEKIRAAGQAKAAQIYLDAYKQSPSFYQFFRSLRAYRDVFNNNHAVMVLKPTGHFFDEFNHISVMAQEK